MKKITIKNRAYYLPECWQDCNFEQLKKIAFLFCTEKKTENQYDFLLKILALYISPSLMARISPEDLVRLSQIIAWLTNPNLDIIQIPRKAKTYKGFLLPTEGLANINVSQYINAETNYIDFIKTQKLESLHKFCASLLLPLNFFWQNSKFDDTLPHLPKVQKLPQNFMWLLFLYFASCKEQITKLYSILYEQDDTETQTAAGSWVDILFDVTETKVFGTLDQVGDTPIHNFLALCQKKKKDFLAQKQQYEQSTTN